MKIRSNLSWLQDGPTNVGGHACVLKDGVVEVPDSVALALQGLVSWTVLPPEAPRAPVVTERFSPIVEEAPKVEEAGPAPAQAIVPVTEVAEVTEAPVQKFSPLVRKGKKGP